MAISPRTSNTFGFVTRSKLSRDIDFTLLKAHIYHSILIIFISDESWLSKSNIIASHSGLYCQTSSTSDVLGLVWCHRFILLAVVITLSQYHSPCKNARNIYWLNHTFYNNIPALVQTMIWCRSDNKSLSEPMMVVVYVHTCICVTRPQRISLIIQWLVIQNPFKSHRVRGSGWVGVGWGCTPGGMAYLPCEGKIWIFSTWITTSDIGDLSFCMYYMGRCVEDSSVICMRSTHPHFHITIQFLDILYKLYPTYPAITL